MIMSGLMERLQNCPSQVCPPRMSVYLRSILCRNVLSTLVIWSARSLVGMSMSALAPLICEWDCSLLMMGSRQERVLPEPVLQQTTTSFPSMIKGMVFFWTGVGLRSLLIMRLRNNSGKKEYCAKPLFCGLGLAGCLVTYLSSHSPAGPQISSWFSQIFFSFDIILQTKGEAFPEQKQTLYYWNRKLDSWIIFISLEVSMSLFAKILSQFSRIKLNDKTQFSEYEVNRAMDQLVQLNAGYSQFDRQIAEQLWQHTTKNPEGKVLLKDYIQTIMDARSILKESIDKCSKQLIYEQDPAKKQQLKECLLSYGQDYRIIGEPLHLQQQPSRNASMSKSEIDRSRISREHSQLSSQIFTGTTSNRQVSPSLKIVIMVVLALLVCQILCMFVRHHFMNFLTYVAIVAIFTQNYFDRLYIIFCEVALGVSLILDLIWVIIHSADYWNPSKETQYSHLQPGLLKLVFIMTLIAMLGKALIGTILFRFVKNTESTVKVVYFLDKKIELNGKIENNPISALLAPRNT